MRQLTLPIIPEAPRSFETFVPGHNAWALAQLSELAQGTGAGGMEPVYLWGPAGCGKTHLLRSLASQLRTQEREVGWFDEATPLPWDLGAAPALTVLDHCERYEPARQHAAFALFVDATARGAWVAAAGRLPPVDLPLRDDLRSRLGWGHVIALEPLAEAEVAAVWAGEARRRGLDLSDELRDYILNRCPRDLGHLMDLLERADAYALARHRVLTVPLLRQMLAEAGTEGPGSRAA